MATITSELPASGGRDDRFFLGGAFAMAVVIVAGFSVQLAMGRSSFASPPLVHAHAIVFMGWVTIYVLQNILATTGRVELHKRLGWIAAVWMLPMLVLGCAVTVAMVRRGGVPFFFRPLQFLVFDPLTLLTFAGLTVAAILLRRQTDWHRRLHFCGMSLLLGRASAGCCPCRCWRRGPGKPLWRPAWSSRPWECGRMRAAAAASTRRGPGESRRWSAGRW